MIDLTSKKTIKELLEKYAASPNKTLGQNFLAEKKAILKIIEAVNLSSDDIVMEIGPGLGVLTLELAKKCKKVIAIEKDIKMIEILKNILTEEKIDNVEVIRDDVLKIKIDNLVSEKYKLIGNLPYYITSAIIKKFLETKNKPELMTFTIQKEVAQRICSKPPKMSILSTAVQYYASPKIIAEIKAGSFWPAPKVDSSIINIIPNREREEKDKELFFKIVKSGFSNPRKMLAGNLSRNLKIKRELVEKILQKADLPINCRAQELDIEKWEKLAKEIAFQE